MITSGMMSSNTCEWETPIDFFTRLDEEFHFTLDVCATPENAKCRRFFTKEDDGLRQEWKGTCWMNPPYGRVISLWMKKALDSSLGGGNCGVPDSGEDGYRMVAQLRDTPCVGDKVHQGKAQVLRQSACAVPFGSGGVQATGKWPANGIRRCIARDWPLTGG